MTTQTCPFICNIFVYLKRALTDNPSFLFGIGARLGVWFWKTTTNKIGQLNLGLNFHFKMDIKTI